VPSSGIAGSAAGCGGVGIGGGLLELPVLPVPAIALGAVVGDGLFSDGFAVISGLFAGFLPFFGVAPPLSNSGISPVPSAFSSSGGGIGGGGSSLLASNNRTRSTDAPAVSKSLPSPLLEIQGVYFGRSAVMAPVGCPVAVSR
jgi:hypothetical protein